MASKSLTLLSLFLLVNVLFFSLAVAEAGGCPKDDIDIAKCASMLNADNLKIGVPKLRLCCSLVKNLPDRDVGLCLCAAFRGSVPGIDSNTSKDIDSVLKACGKSNPPEVQCPK